MDSCLFSLNSPHAFYASRVSSNSKQENHNLSGCRSMSPRQSLRWQKGHGLAVKCGGGNRLKRPESKRKDEVNEKCDGIVDESKDVNEKVELMEMEAIMGKDDGREPMDYKRRACIFYKSSEMFQAIKDEHHHPHHCTQN